MRADVFDKVSLKVRDTRTHTKIRFYVVKIDMVGGGLSKFSVIDVASPDFKLIL